MAECHPVGFQWVMEAKQRGAKIIHIDPRFTRTSAVADLHVPIRAGSDIALLGAIVNYILANGREFREYVESYTNADVIVGDEFRDAEDLDGLFSGWDPESRSYDTSSWAYKPAHPSATSGEGAGEGEGGGGGGGGPSTSGEQSHGAHGGDVLEHGEPPKRDPTLQDPRCVFQLLKRHYSRYTPEMVQRICGIPEDMFLEIAESVCANSGRERTTAFVYSVGWTQHTVGAQYIRAASIVQLLLGNIGRPGGGIMALRGHASIQGSTDIPTLYNILPGYLPMPGPDTSDLDHYVEEHAPKAGFWGHTREYTVSLLKAWWGDAATAESDFGFGHLPRINGDHSTYQSMMDMLDGKLRGFFVMGENPAVGSANGKLQRLAMANVDWMVVRDLTMIETAEFWRNSPEIESGELQTEDIATEVFFMPAAAHTEKDGSFTNTQRLLQWHRKAIDPPQDCRSELWFMFHLGRRVREKLAGSSDARDRAILDLTWDYPTDGEHQDPKAGAVLREISGVDLTKDEALDGYMALKADGSTISGCWIYCGSHAGEVNQTDRRKPGSQQTWVAPEWGWAWPMNRRILYNRASADPDGNPWSERKRYVWWDPEQEQWTGADVPDFKLTMAPDYVPDDDAQAEDALRGDKPFVMQADGRGWLFASTGLTDGPFPAHYEPHESPVGNPLYAQQANPTRQQFARRENQYNPPAGQPGADVFPFVFTTYRLTEHHTAGGMSRTLPYLAELQPEFFCEVSPELAAERKLEHGDWATIVTSRSAIEARVLVTERIAPLRIGGRTIHQIGLPYHWGRSGYATGDSANDLTSLVLDSNVHISEFKEATCDIVPGRRPRGPALPEFVAGYRQRAQSTASADPAAPVHGTESPDQNPRT
jgi:formate dehydrogenase major subunit